MTTGRKLAFCLAMAIVGGWSVTGSAQSANNGGSQSVCIGGALAKPLPGGQKWTAESALVWSANVALVKYAGLPAGAQTSLAPAARTIAKLRRVALRHLMSSDPRQALLLSLAPAQREGLPKFAIDLLERRVHSTGDLLLQIEETLPGPGKDTPPQLPDPTDNPDLTGNLDSTDNVDFQNGPLPKTRTYWRARLGQAEYRASVYGIRLQHETKYDTPIHGIALGDLVAVSESPLYQYDPWETRQLGFPTGTIVATDGELPIPMTDVGALVELENELVSVLLQFGPRPALLDPFEWTTGQKDVLVLKVAFRDAPEETTPHSDLSIYRAFLGVDIFFRDNSRGKTWFAADVYPEPLVVGVANLYRFAHGLDLLETHALDEAERIGLIPAEYDRVIIMAPQLFATFEANAGATVGGAVIRISGESPALFVTLTHELGHTYGFVHSALWKVPNDSGNPIGPGTYETYLDGWDVMGRANLETEGLFYQRHFNAYFKARAGWLPGDAIADGRTGGSRLNPGRLFALYPHDSPTTTGLRAIYVRAADGTTYWIGKRSAFPENPSMEEGVEIRRVQTPSELHGQVELLDLDPDFGDFYWQHSLRAHRSFQDLPNGIIVDAGQERTDEDGNEYQFVSVVMR